MTVTLSPAEMDLEQGPQELLRALGKDPHLIPYGGGNFGLPLEFLEPQGDLIVPTAQFFLRCNGPIPRLDPATWTLAIAGHLTRPVTLTLADLHALPQRTLTAFLECAGNGRTRFAPLPPGTPWHNDAVGNAVWEGVPLRDVLDLVGIRDGAVDLVSQGGDFPAMQRGLPLSVARAPDTLLVLGMNGEPLTIAHGGPVRLLVPGWAGIASTKWLVGLTVLDHAFAGFWNADNYVYWAEDGTPLRPVAAMPVKSLISAPRDGQVLAPGPTHVTGYAWSGQGAIAQVEVSVDGGGSWAAAEIEQPGRRSWARFAYAWEARPGRHTVLARATDARRLRQPMMAAWNGKGYGQNGVHQVGVTVSKPISPNGRHRKAEGELGMSQRREQTEWQPGGPLDGAAIRADFPILDQTNERGQRLVFLDSAASSQKPRPVLEAHADYYHRYNANIHRGVYALSEQATNRYEAAREEVAAFLNAATPRECIFVRNTTEAINLVALTWGRRNIGPDDLIVNTVLDHHSNLVPWQLLTAERGAQTAYVRITADGQLDLNHYEELLARKPKLVAFSHVSNAVGTVNDAALLTRRAKEVGATVLIDAAQSAPHRALDVQAIGCDFLAFSGHKALAPMGSGALYGRLDLLEEMPPFMVGGGTIGRVSLNETIFAAVPGKFEAGTPAVGEAIGLGVATRYLSELGLEQVAAHEEHLAERARAALAEIPGVELHGPLTARARSGIVGFTIDGLHPAEVSEVLDAEHIAVRAGRHCCHPLFNALGLDAIIRASFYLYNTEDDVDRLIAGVEKARRALAPRAFAANVRTGDPCATRLSA